MTQYPEAILARELELCYVNIALITDYDAGLEGRADVQPVSAGEVERFFVENNYRVRDLILTGREPSRRARLLVWGRLARRVRQRLSDQ